MQRRRCQCQCDPREAVTMCTDAARATADYIAGYAEGLADKGD